MTSTPHLGLVELTAAQSQKHVTVNEGLQRLDEIVNLSVIDRDLTTPPTSPSTGDTYIPAATATGAWRGWEGRIVFWDGTAWQSIVPAAGWPCWIADEATPLIYDGSAWVSLLASSPNGATIGMGVIEEELTGLSGATATTTIAIPDRANVLAVSTRTTTAITGATSYDCGDGTTANKFGGSLGVASGSTNVGAVGADAYYAATNIVLTANGSVFTSGAVRVAIQYMLATAPKS